MVFRKEQKHLFWIQNSNINDKMFVLCAPLTCILVGINEYGFKKYTIYRIFALSHLQTVSSPLEFAQTQLCLKRNNLRHWKSPRYKLPTDNEGEGTK